MSKEVHHPSHYGGKDNPYEAIKIIEDWHLGYGFCLGNALKYISRAEHKGSRTIDLRKSLWYLKRAVEKEHASEPIARTGSYSASEVTTGWGLTGHLLMTVQLIACGNIPGAIKELEAELRGEGDAGDDEAKGESE